MNRLFKQLKINYKDIDLEPLLKDLRNDQGIAVYQTGYRCSERITRKHKVRNKKWTKEKLLNLIRCVIITIDRKIVTKELFSRVLKADIGLVDWCFMKLKTEGYIDLIENDGAHDTNREKHGFCDGSGWAPTLFYLKGKE